MKSKKTKIDPYPYSLKVIFNTDIKYKSLLDIMKTNGINHVKEINNTEDRYRHFRYYFDIDFIKNTKLEFSIDKKKELVKHFYFDIAQQTDIDVIKQVFVFLNYLKDEFELKVLDVELESMLNLANCDDSIIDEKSTIPVNYDDFYSNSFNIPKREALLKKI